MQATQKFLCQSISAIMAGALLVPLPALSQEKSAKGLEEVIVTARKTEENIQNIPVAITALSADDLLKRGVLNVKDITQQTPSLMVTAAAANPTAVRLSMRGQVQNDTLFTLDPSVGIYLDDVYLGRSPGAMIDMYDVARVEVLKGPQGTLYGRNTTGGALKIITNKADAGAGIGGYIKGGYGNYDAKKVEGGINVPLIEDKLAMRVAGLINKRDGYSTNSIIDPISGALIKKQDQNDKDTESARVDIVLNATDKLNFEVNLDYSDIRTNGTLMYNARGDRPSVPQSSISSLTIPALYPANYGVIYGSPAGNGLAGLLGWPTGTYVRSSNDPLKGSSNVEGYANNRAFGGSLTTTYDFADDLVGKIVLANRRMDGEYNLDVDGSSMGLATSTQDFGQEQNSVELQLTGNSFDSLEWVVGGFWFRETGYEQSGQNLFVFPGTLQGTLAAPYNGTGENKSKSVYAQATWRFTDTISFTGGVRDTWDSKAMVTHNYTQFGLAGGGFGMPGATSPSLGICNFTAGAPGITSITGPDGSTINCTSDQSKNYQHISWTAGVDWQASDAVLLYAKSSNGYRAGGQNLRGKQPRELIPFGEETVTDIELGAKSTLWDNRLRANLAVYRSNYKDIQSSIFLPAAAGSPSGTQVVNLTNAEINGVELELTAQVMDALVLTASGSYTDTAYNDKLDAAGQASYPAGLQPIFSPRWKYAFGGTYTQPLSVGELSYNLNYSWRDKFWSNPDKLTNTTTPESSTGAVGVVNARIALELTAYDATVALWGTNLTDEHYSVNAFLFTLGGPEVVNTSPEEPRMFGVDITKKF